MLDAPVPIKALNGETVGEVEVDSFQGSLPRPETPWQDGFALPPRAEFPLDESLQSGVYLLDGTIPFVHRGGGSPSVAILLPSNTGIAFNEAGGRNLYDKIGAPAADVLSFQRPLRPGMLMNGCVPLMRWFCNGNPFRGDMTYLIDSDLEGPDILDGIEVLLVLGRSEYWTRAARECFDTFVDRGGRALLLCSETMHWQARVDLERHQLICPKYHDQHPNPLLRAMFWHDPSLEYPIYPRTGCELWHGGSAAKSEGIGWDGMRITCADSPLLDGAELAEGDVVALPRVRAWDGAPAYRAADGAIQVDFGAHTPWFYHEVIGYNQVKPAVGEELPAGQPAMSLWLALRHRPSSGAVVHGGCMAWCGERVVGDSAPDRDRNRHLILNMLRLLRDDAWPFTLDAESLDQPGSSAAYT